MVNQSDAETQPEATGVSHFTAEVTNGTNEGGGGRNDMTFTLQSRHRWSFVYMIPHKC